MRTLTVLALLLAPACSEGPKFAVLEVDVAVARLGSGTVGRVVSVGGYEVRERVPTSVDPAVGRVRLGGNALEVGRAKPLKLRIVAEPGKRRPTLRVEVSNRGTHDAIHVVADRRPGEDAWTVFLGHKPSYPLPCYRDGFAVRCNAR